MNRHLPLLSIIVPVLNEAPLLKGFLRKLRRLHGDFEIIIVDGGSSDGSRSIAEAAADRVLSAPRGRALQMNVGAAIAHGDVLWFLHADLEVPPNAIDDIRTALRDPKRAGGCFRLRYPRREWIYRVSDSLGNIGVTVFGFALGDHGIFCRRAAFLEAAGYPIVPILEDAELCRRLRRVGKMIQLSGEIVSSPRTFEHCGRYRTTGVYFAILLLYVVGARIAWLNRIYHLLHRSGGAAGVVARRETIGPVGFPRVATPATTPRQATP